MNYEILFGVYVDYYAAFLAILMIFILLVKRDHQSLSGRFLFLLLLFNAVILLLEGSSYLVNKQAGQLNSILNYSFNYLLFLFTPFIGSLWAIYIDFTLFHDLKRIKKRYYYFYPVFVGLILLFINMFHPILYTITNNNVYQRLPFTYLTMSVLYLLFLYMVYLVLRNYKRVRKHTFYGLIAFIILPVLGGTIQMIYVGISTLYSTLTLGIVTVYIINETIHTTRDFDTNLLTRKKAYDYMEYLLFRNKDYTITLFDLDDFKRINDNFGHLVGDKALITFSTILAQVFQESYAYRFGGDEFLIISPYINDDKTTSNLEHLNTKLKDLSDSLPYTLQTSYGLATHHSSLDETTDNLLYKADEMLYLAKKHNKNLKRRENDA